MAATIIYGDSEPIEVGSRTSGGELWLESGELTRATGWEIKPEGICRDQMCIPLPADQSNLLSAEGDRTFLSLSGFERYLGRPYAQDDELGAWCFGESPEERRSKLLSLEAPDFTLPDLAGQTHSLSDLRGKKVLLLLWASW